MYPIHHFFENKNPLEYFLHQKFAFQKQSYHHLHYNLRFHIQVPLNNLNPHKPFLKYDPLQNNTSALHHNSIPSLYFFHILHSYRLKYVDLPYHPKKHVPQIDKSNLVVSFHPYLHNQAYFSFPFSMNIVVYFFSPS